MGGIRNLCAQGTTDLSESVAPPGYGGADLDGPPSSQPPPPAPIFFIPDSGGSSFSSVPEPTTPTLLILGGICLTVARFKRKRV